MRIRTNATFFALAFLLTISVASIYSQPAQLAGLDEYIEKARQEWKVPGMAVAIVKDDKIVRLHKHYAANVTCESVLVD